MLVSEYMRIKQNICKGTSDRKACHECIFAVICKQCEDSGCPELCMKHGRKVPCLCAEKDPDFAIIIIETIKEKEKNL